jgi:predicted nuclease of predicted toxin-antitoxin system
VGGLQSRFATLDLVRVQDIGLASVDDPTILEWAAREGRILLTHDVATMIRYAYERVRAGLPMPGVIEVSLAISTGRAIEDLLLIAECSREGEWEAGSASSLSEPNRRSRLTAVL